MVSTKLGLGARAVELAAKLPIIQAGIGWGGLPEHVKKAVRERELAVLCIREFAVDVLELYTVRRRDRTDRGSQQPRCGRGSPPRSDRSSLARGGSVAHYRGTESTLSVELAAPGVALLEFSGRDVGEFGAQPFDELTRMFGEHGSLELFIDARHAKGATLDVSGEWAAFLRANKGRLRHVSMLTGSRFIQLSAEFVRRFAELGEVMRLYTEPAVFEGALAHATANTR